MTLPDDDAVLDVRNLSTVFETPQAVVRAVDDVSFSVRRGETLGIVGESGSGKSVSALSLMDLVPPPGRIVSGEVRVNGRNLRGVTSKEMQQVRGAEVAMIFQSSMTALNPALTVGWQIEEAVLAHGQVNKGRRFARKEAKAASVAAMSDVGIADGASRRKEYPHQFSGGMQQRIAIAMALINRPSILIADEPTTALDVTVQEQILALLKERSAASGMALLLITHDIGVIARMCDRVAVMYAGQIVEEGPVHDVFLRPSHPYTRALLTSLPRPDHLASSGLRRLPTIGGEPLDMESLPDGCRFQPRCKLAVSICSRPPSLKQVAAGHLGRCWVTQQEAGLSAEGFPAPSSTPDPEPSSGSDRGNTT